MNVFIILFGKVFSVFSKRFNLGEGSTWPGHIALKLNPNFIEDIVNKSKTKIILVAGTNGKTTTARLITSVIRENNKTYLQNKAGANLINGLASTLITGASANGTLNKNYLIFESDENALSEIAKKTNPDYIIILDLFRDQLDRYGELNTVADKWKKGFGRLNDKTRLILNADDPLVSSLAKNIKAKILYFGLDEKGASTPKHGADSIYCPNCGNKLNYKRVFFSHLGEWECPKCGLKRPKINLSDLSNNPLPGTYNKYNGLAASLFALEEGFSKKTIENSFKNFTPAFGRQEKLSYKGKSVQIFLSKNPTSFNESLQTIKELGGKNLLIVLNDRIPDGLDVSWIWDINFEDILTKEFNLAVSGDRVYDMAIRLKYAGFFTHTEEVLKKAIDKMAETLEKDETLFILPNYSAMLEARKLITGKKLL